MIQLFGKHLHRCDEGIKTCPAAPIGTDESYHNNSNNAIEYTNWTIEGWLDSSNQ